MKKTLLFLFLFTLSSIGAFSQALIHIDSVVVRPANPTASDPVYLHFYGWCGYGAALSGPPTVVTFSNTHSVSACYIVNVLAVITNIHDSVHVFTGPAAVHTIVWDVQQNMDQFAPVCDTTVASGSENVIVVTTSVDQLTNDPFALSWNAADHSFLYSSAGKTTKTLSVYTMSGQLVAKEQLNASAGKINLGEEASGLFIAVVEDENGILRREKVYCH
jgi:hypothetical protein